MADRRDSQPWTWGSRGLAWGLAALAAAGFALACTDRFPSGPNVVDRVLLAPQGPVLAIGDSAQLRATAIDKQNTALVRKRAVWLSATPSVASVTETGMVYALQAGSTVISATIDGREASTTVLVVPPPVDSIVISPAGATIVLGRNSQFSAATYDARGRLLTGRVLDWASTDPAVATVSASGLVTSAGLGSAFIVVTSEGRSDSAAITVIPVPVRQIVVTPDPALVQLGGTLQLTADTRDSVGGSLPGRAVAWSSANPAIVTVSTTGLLTGIALGTTAVTASSEGVAVQVPVTVSAPVISVSTATVSVTDRSMGGNPPPVAIDVTNGGSFTLSGLSTAVTYGAGASGWLSASLSQTTAPATVSLQATTGSLAPATYTATLTISSSQPGVAPRTVDVTFVVTPFPVIAASNTSPAFAAQVGGSDPAPQSIAITNSGTGTLNGLAASVSYGSGATGWLGASLAGTTAPTSLALQPITGSLPVGVYTATVTITSTVSGVAAKDLSVTFTVAQGPIIGLSKSSVAPTQVAFSTIAVLDTVAVTNPGGGTLTGLSAGIAYGAGASGWLIATLGSTTAPTALILSSDASTLAAGTYTATVTVASSSPGVASQTVNVTFTVTPQPVIVVTPASRSFTATRGAASPAPQTVSVTNGGGSTLSGLSASVTYGAGASGWLGTALSSSTAPSTLTLTPATGSLGAGTFTATVTISSTVPGVASKAVDVSLTVEQPQIALGQSTVALGSRTRGAAIAASSISVSNGGQGTLSNLSVLDDASWITSSLASATAPTNLTLDFNTAGLPAGSYTGTATVSSSLPGVASQTVTVTVTVLQPQIGASPANPSFTTTVGTSPSPSSVSITNTGSGTLDGLSRTVSYAVGQPTGWLTATLNSTSAPTTISLSYATASLGFGTFTAFVTVSSTVPGVADAVITVTVTNRWSFSQHISPLLASCTGCHDQTFTVYANIVNATATTGTACDSPARIRVTPSDTTASLLYRKLSGSQPCGARMPPPSGGWSAADLAKLREWIFDGAPNN